MRLIDSNVLITAKNTYYAFNRVPEFWEWLLHVAESGAVKMPIEMVDEIVGGTDDLARWLGNRDHRSAICLDEDADIAIVQHVLDQYAPDLNDADLIKIGADPFIIAHALKDPDERIVVTGEISKPTCQRAK